MTGPDQTFTTVSALFRNTERQSDTACRIVHCLNPFYSPPGSEHDRALRVTLAAMNRARSFVQAVAPEIEVQFAKIVDDDGFESDLLEFDISATLSRTILDILDVNVPRPLPLIMDLITAVPAQNDDILVFTNADIVPTPGFYEFIAEVFARGIDCAIINRRTVSDVYLGEADLSFITAETGEPHPGFDCFAFRAGVRNKLLPYQSCTGIGGVMLPLVHQLLAFSNAPVVLLDAHTTVHVGNDLQWKDARFQDYHSHNRSEIDRIFDLLIEQGPDKDRFLARLSSAPQTWGFPPRLRKRAGFAPPPPKPRKRGWRSRISKLLS